nr:retrovirus-related Pol polyprotein from transposon TNT 1-94 [Tanacetum cinerariifolium]
TNITRITRKEPKPDKNGHENGKSTSRAGNLSSKVNLEKYTAFCQKKYTAFCSCVLLLRFALAFCSCYLVLRFPAAFWFCVLLIEDSSCVLPREDSASFKTWLRFVSKTSCILSQDLLRFVSRPPAFCLKTYCVLSQDTVAFCLKTWLCFVSRPPATDFASWQQRIRLYCRGKENGMNILKSIDEGPYQKGTVREPFAKGTEGAPHLGQERPRVLLINGS